MGRIYIGPITDPEKSKKLREQSRIEFTNNSNSFTSLNTSASDFIFNTGTVYGTGSTTCAVLSCHPAVGMCTYAFDVGGSYGFKGMPLDMSIALYAAGTIPGNATADAGPSISGSNPRNGTDINSFVSGDGSIYNESLYADIVDGGYTFQNTDVEADLSFSTCGAYENYTSAQAANFQGYGVTSPAVIQVGDGEGTELDASHCGTIANIISDHLTQSSCENGSYTLNSVAYSGTDYINWSTLS